MFPLRNELLIVGKLLNSVVEASENLLYRYIFKFLRFKYLLFCKRERMHTIGNLNYRKPGYITKRISTRLRII